MNSNPHHFLTTPMRTLQLMCILTATLLLSACSQGPKSAAGGVSDPTGNYTLVSVNGKNVPASVTHDGTSLQVRAGTFTINADGTCGTTTTFVPPSGSEVKREVAATYTQEGTKLNMQWKGAGTTTGTFDGQTFTMNNEGMVFVYRK